MKKFIILLILMLAPYAFAAPYFSGGGSGGGAAVLIYTVGTLPASPADGTVYAVTDGADAADCTVGSGTTLNLCMWDDGGSAYVIVGDGAGSGNAFSTHDAPAGTDPVATGADTLTWLDTAPVVITGDSGADSMTVSVNTATTSAEGVSEWATDAEAIALTADRVLVTSSIDNVLAEPPAIGGTTAGAVTGSTVTSEGSFVIGGADMNQADLEKLDGITNGTQAANKAVVADANVNTGVSKVTELHIGTSGSETQVTATGAELNALDGNTSSAAQLSYLDAADGETGSGSVVFDNTPSLITPDLGAATGTSLAVAGNVATSSGNVVAGTNDTTLGSFIVYGGGGSAAGGYIDLYNSADDDAAGVQDFWRIRAAATNLQIGIEGALTTSSAFILNADGSINKSATPKIVLDDTDGADGYIDLNAADADDAVMTLGVDDSNGDDQAYIELDGVNETVEVKYPLTAPSVDAGIKFEDITADTDLTGADADICKKIYFMGSTSNEEIEFELQASPICSTGVSRELVFYNGETDNYNMMLDPNGTDGIIIAGGEVCTDGYRIQCDNDLSVVRLIGRSATKWLAIIEGGTCICAGS